MLLIILTHVGEDYCLRLSALSQVNVLCQDVDAEQRLGSEYRSFHPHLPRHLARRLSLCLL